MHFSHFPSVFVKVPDLALDADWEDFASYFVQRGHLLIEGVSKEAKSRADAYNFYQLNTSAEWPDGHQKHTGVKLLSAAVADLDDATSGKVEQIREVLSDYEYLAHTSHRHMTREVGGLERWRFILPLAEPIAGDRWKGAWYDLADKLRGIDVACKDPTRMYYMPSCPPDMQQYAQLYRNHGELLRLDPSRKPPAPVREEGSLAVSRDTFARIASRWQRSAGLKAELGSRLTLICEGARFAQDGEVNTTVYRVVCSLVQEIPEVDPSSVVDLFRMSLDGMGATNPSLEQVHEMVGRAKESASEKAAEQTAEQDADRAARLARAGRTGPYSEGELVALQAALGSPLESAWVVQKDARYFVLSPGMNYRDCARDSVVALARDMLSPAPILTEVQTQQQGWRDMTAAELVKAHGQAVTRVDRSLLLERPRLRDNALTLPAGMRRKIIPQESAECDHWLRLLGGEKAEQLLDWLALAPDLSRPLCAVVVTGDPGAGKSLLAEGLSRIWTEAGPTKLKQLLGNFNAGLATSPIGLADEEFPKDFRGNPRTEELREIIQASHWAVNPKYGLPYDLHGCGRFILSANNESILDTSGPMTRSDMQAIAARYLCLEPDLGAARYLRKLGERSYVQPNWLDSDVLPGHILWLAANRGTSYQGRFGVVTDEETIKRLAVRNSLRSVLIEVIVKAMLGGTDLLRCPTGVALDVKALMRYWENIKGQAPPLMTVARVLREVATPLPDAYWAIPRQALVDWLELCTYCTIEEIDRCLNN